MLQDRTVTDHIIKERTMPARHGLLMQAVACLALKNYTGGDYFEANIHVAG